MNQFPVVKWCDDHLVLLDQTKVPPEISYVPIHTLEELWEAIRANVRDTNTIGILAAYGIYLGIQDKQFKSFEELWNEVYRISVYLKGSQKRFQQEQRQEPRQGFRKASVQLAHTLTRIRRKIEALQSTTPIDLIVQAVLAEARNIQDEDMEMCLDSEFRFA